MAISSPIFSDRCMIFYDEMSAGAAIKKHGSSEHTISEA